MAKAAIATDFLNLYLEQKAVQTSCSKVLHMMLGIDLDALVSDFTPVPDPDPATTATPIYIA